ncbi:ada [Bugula neritina]|uniref:Adenosine deaminase n=1 Tax=Bugula neritina TaxID=10212 RepID=A0A7J7JZL2_BUGNE|nr:ada [Bugula neritina]
MLRNNAYPVIRKQLRYLYSFKCNQPDSHTYSKKSFSPALTYFQHFLNRSFQTTSNMTSNFQITAKVQLHVHLDGSPRLTSILPLARKRGITLPVSTEEELRKAVVMTQPETLPKFLDRFKYFAPAYTGSLDAIRQLAREFAEDMAADDVIYSEPRYCPHLLIGDSKITADEIVEAVNDEYSKAEQKLNIKLRQILCCIRDFPEYSLDIARLCEKYKGKGVVAIDIAGDESGAALDPRHVEAFDKAKAAGVHRTVHAGESTVAAVPVAIDELHANRIGHGYHTVENEALYQKLLRMRMHFECCPNSSIFTGACKPDWAKHPIKRFADDNFSFSLSTDDPVITDTNLSQEFDVVQNKIGVSKLRLLKTIYDGARNAFLPDAEKTELLNKLNSVYNPPIEQLYFILLSINFISLVNYKFHNLCCNNITVCVSSINICDYLIGIIFYMNVYVVPYNLIYTSTKNSNISKYKNHIFMIFGNFDVYIIIF